MPSRSLQLVAPALIGAGVLLSGCSIDHTFDLPTQGTSRDCENAGTAGWTCTRTTAAPAGHTIELRFVREGRFVKLAEIGLIPGATSVQRIQYRFNDARSSTIVQEIPDSKGRLGVDVRGVYASKVTVTILAYRDTAPLGPVNVGLFEVRGDGSAPPA